ncbi:MAG: hypothetical protein ACJ77B_11365 [Chloroflexota bacterium]
MTDRAMTDLDRVLGDWLADGPSRAPDRVVDAAIEHCRSHPRRPDPFAFLRSDVLAARRSALALQPAFALVALGLLLVAIVAFAAGSRRDEAPVVVPPLPTPSATRPPTPSPTVAAVHVVLPDELGKTVTVDVVDESGALVSARAGLQSEEGDIPEVPHGIGAANAPNDPTVLRLTWADGPCESAGVLSIDAAARSFVLVKPACTGDSLGVGRVIVLTFSRPVPATGVTATLDETP